MFGLANNPIAQKGHYLHLRDDQSSGTLTRHRKRRIRTPRHRDLPRPKDVYYYNFNYAPTSYSSIPNIPPPGHHHQSLVPVTPDRLSSQSYHDPNLFRGGFKVVYQTPYLAHNNGLNSVDCTQPFLQRLRNQAPMTKYYEYRDEPAMIHHIRNYRARAVQAKKEDAQPVVPLPKNNMVRLQPTPVFYCYPVRNQVAQVVDRTRDLRDIYRNTPSLRLPVDVDVDGCMDGNRIIYEVVIPPNAVVLNQPVSSGRNNRLM